MLKNVMGIFFLFAGALFCPISQQAMSAINSITAATTKEIIYQNILKGILDPFLDDYTKQSTADWAAFSNASSNIFNKSSKSGSIWNIPFIGVAGSQKTLRDYFYAQLAFVIEDLSPAPASIKSSTKNLISSLVGISDQVDSSLVLPLTKSNFVFKVASSDKVLFIKDDGTVASQAASYFSQNTSFRVLSIQQASRSIRLCSFKNLICDKNSMSFSLPLNSPAGLDVVIKQDQASGYYYLVTLEGKYFNVSSDSLVLSDTGTLFDMISVPVELYEISGDLPIATAKDIDDVITKFVKAIECCSKKSVDLARCIELLKNYCSKAMLSSYWFVLINQYLIKQSSPSFFVKKYLTTLLSLPWYQGLTDVIKKDIDDFIKKPLFSSVLQSIDLVATDVLSVINPLAEGFGFYAADSGNFYFKQDGIDFDVSTHLIIDSFQPTTSQVSLSIKGKALSIDLSSGKILFGSGAPVLFKIVQMTDSDLYSLYDSKGRSLVVDSVNNIGFFPSGTILSLRKLSVDKKIIGGLSGDTFKDLNILEKFVFDLRASEKMLAYGVSLLLQLIDTKKTNSEWFVKKGVDLSGQALTGNEYSIGLLNKIKDNSTDLFTGATSDLLAKITTALTSSEDKGLSYPKLLENLDSLAVAAKPEDLFENSELAQVITDLATKFAAAGDPSLRSNLIQKIDTYYEGSTNFSAVAGVADLTRWHTFLFNTSLAILNFNLDNSTVVFEQINYFINIIVPRLLKLNSTLMLLLLKNLSETSLKKVVNSIVQLKLSGPAVDSINKVIKDLKALISALSASPEKTAVLAAVLSMESSLNPKKKKSLLPDLNLLKAPIDQLQEKKPSRKSNLDV